MKTIYEITEYMAVAEQHAARAGYAAFAHSYTKKLAEPENPHKNLDADCFWAWHQGFSMAKQHLLHWEDLDAVSQENFHAMGESGSFSACCKNPKPVDVFAELEKRVEMSQLAILDIMSNLLKLIKENIGDTVKDSADFQTIGFARLSVEQQKNMLAFFKEKLEILNEAARWLSVGKTQIEQGFMAVERCLYNSQLKTTPPK